MNQIERARSALHHLDPGCSREDWIRIAMAAKAAGLSFDDFHDWSRSGFNYKSENDCVTAWKSIDEEGSITAATLFYVARQNGWVPIYKARINKSGLNQKNDRYSNKKITTNNRAKKIFDMCVPATAAHEYISRKNGIPHELKVYPSEAPPLVIDGQNVAGYLAVPCLSDGMYQTLQFIPPGEGKKLNLGGASFNDGFFTVGEINKDTPKVYLTESIGSAWAAFQATGAASVVTFGFHRMPTVAKVICSKYPQAKLAIVPDRGKESESLEIARCIGCQWVELPQDKPSNYDINDYALQYGYAALETLLKEEKSFELHYKVLTGLDLLSLPPMQWLLHGILPAQGLMAIYGASGSGKSFLVLDMAFAIAGTQNQWFGFHVNHVPVTYVCLEGEAGISKRLQAWRHYFKTPFPDKLHFIMQPFNLLSDDLQELAKAIVSSKGAGGLVILDTLNRATPGCDENSSLDMGRIIAAAHELQGFVGGTVLLVHHSGKDASRGMRGHSSLNAALDGALEVSKTTSHREWSVSKSKDDATGKAYPFKLEVVTIGVDDQGQQITSCVAKFDDSLQTALQNESKLGSNQKIALKVINSLLMESKYIGMEGAPEQAICVGYDLAVSKIAERLSTDKKHRKSRAQQAIAALVSRGVLDMKGDWLWRV